MSEDGNGLMKMCIYKYTNSTVDPEDKTYDLNRETVYCILKTLSLKDV